MALSEGPTPAFEAIERSEEVLSYGLVDRQAEAVALLALAPLHAMIGDLGRARELSARGADLLRDLGATVLATQTSCSSSRIEFIAGDALAAESKLRADYDALTAMDERYVRPIVAALLAKALVALDRLDEAHEVVGVAAEIASLDDIEAQALVRSVQANLHAAHGRPAQAESLAREVVLLVSQTDSPVLRADALLDVSFALAGSPEERLRVLGEARALYEGKQHLLGVAQVEACLAESPRDG
jgi:ATP/maltotriose-dependent transcriptional regulator MalT